MCRVRIQGLKAKVYYKVTYALEFVRFAHSGIKTQGKELLDKHRRAFSWRQQWIFPALPSANWVISTQERTITYWKGKLLQ
jgi:hypothetical protein